MNIKISLLLILASFDLWASCPSKPTYINHSFCQELKKEFDNGGSFIFSLARINLRKINPDLIDKSGELNRCQFRYIYQTCDPKVMASAFVNEYFKLDLPPRGYFEEALEAGLAKQLDPDSKDLLTLFTGTNVFFKDKEKEALETSLLLLKNGYQPSKLDSNYPKYLERLKKTKLAQELELEKAKLIEKDTLVNSIILEMEKEKKNYFNNYSLHDTKSKQSSSFEKMKDLIQKNSNLIEIMKTKMSERDMILFQSISGVDFKIQKPNFVNESTKLIDEWTKSKEDWNEFRQAQLETFLGFKSDLNNSDLIKVMSHWVRTKEDKKMFSETSFWNLFNRLDKEKIDSIQKKELLEMLYSLNRVDWVKSMVEQIESLEPDVVSIAKGLGWCGSSEKIQNESVPADVVVFYQKYYELYRDKRTKEFLALLTKPGQNIDELTDKYIEDFQPLAKDSRGKSIFDYFFENKKLSRSELRKIITRVCKRYVNECIQSAGFFNEDQYLFKKNYKVGSTSSLLIKAAEAADVEFLEMISEIRLNNGSIYYGHEGNVLLWVNAKNKKDKRLKKFVKADPHFNNTLEGK